MIRLLALDAATGEAPLVAATGHRRSPELSRIPRGGLAGASPSYADGILVCPTAAGAVVGVELATRSLLWGYCFSDEGNNGRRNGGMFSPMMSRISEPSATHWLDDSVSICEGRVLTTPADSEWLYCLGLFNGELLWKCPRKDDLYVACVDREKVVLVGRHAVRAVRLADGKPAWDGRTVEPSGRQFAQRPRLRKRRSVLPAAEQRRGRRNRSGRRQDRANARNRAREPCRATSSASRGTSFPRGWKASTPIINWTRCRPTSAGGWRRIPTTPRRFRCKAKSCWTAASVREAIASFRRADQLAPDPRTRELLRDTILDGLRTRVRRSIAARLRGIERLLDDSSQRAAFLRAMAAGLRTVGRIVGRVRLLSEADRHRPASSGRWTRSTRPCSCGATVGFAANWPSFAAKRRAKRRRRSTGPSRRGSSRPWRPVRIEPLQRFCDGFGDQPAAEQAREELIRRLDAAGRRLEAELAAARRRRMTPPSPSRLRSAAKRDADWPVGKIDVSTARQVNNSTRNNYGRGTSESARQPRSLLPRSVAPVRLQPPGDYRLRRARARAVAGVAGGRRPTAVLLLQLVLEPRVRRRPPAPAFAWDGRSLRSTRLGRGPTAARGCCGPRI